MSATARQMTRPLRCQRCLPSAGRRQKTEGREEDRLLTASAGQPRERKRGGRFWKLKLKLKLKLKRSEEAAPSSLPRYSETAQEAQRFSESSLGTHVCSRARCENPPPTVGLKQPTGTRLRSFSSVPPSLHSLLSPPHLFLTSAALPFLKFTLSLRVCHSRHLSIFPAAFPSPSPPTHPPTPPALV